MNFIQKDIRWLTTDMKTSFIFKDINPRTVFWGPFGPRRPKTRYIFLIGQAYLLLITKYVTYSWIGSPYEHWGPNGPQKTVNVSNFENGSRVNATHLSHFGQVFRSNPDRLQTDRK